MEGDRLLHLKQQLAEAARAAYTRGLQTGNGGNLSARLPGENVMIIKGSGSSFADCDAGSWIVTDLTGHVLEGDGRASAEYPVHAAIYRKSERVHAVLHAHSVHTIAVAEHCGAHIPAIAHHSPAKLGGPIPVLDIPTPGITDADLWQVDALLDAHPGLGGFVHRRHGLFALGTAPRHALYNAELMEETAHIAFCTHLLGLAPLPKG